MATGNLYLTHIKEHNVRFVTRNKRTRCQRTSIGIIQKSLVKFPTQYHRNPYQYHNRQCKHHATRFAFKSTIIGQKICALRAHNVNRTKHWNSYTITLVVFISVSLCM